jgi:hypothetical protein
MAADAGRQGRLASERSRFNVGDLANAPYERGPLGDILGRHGIRNLQLDVNSCDDQMPCSFDTHLMNPIRAAR